MKEITYKDWKKNPTPREMWVWDSDRNRKVKRKVIYILNNEDMDIDFPVATLNPDEKEVILFRHCAEIEKSRKMTYQELAWWIRDGNREGKHREWKFSSAIVPTIYSTMNYLENTANEPVGEILVREDGGEWHEPLVEEWHRTF